MIGLHIRDLFWSSLVVEPDAEAGVDETLDTDAIAAALAAELAVMMVFVVVDVGVLVDTGVLVAGVFYNHRIK